MNVIRHAVQCQHGTPLLLHFTHDGTVEPAFDVGRNERFTVPRRPDEMQVEFELVAAHEVSYECVVGCYWIVAIEIAPARHLPAPAVHLRGRDDMHVVRDRAPRSESPGGTPPSGN